MNKRQQDILTLLKEKQYVETKELSKHFFISESSIRRDLAFLENESKLERVKGGAIELGTKRGESRFLTREKENSTEKDYIVELAMNYIQNGQSLFLDSSSTVYRLAKRLHRFKQLKVLTNGNLTSYTLGLTNGIDVYTLGGKIVEGECSIVGVMACEQIKNFSADICFVSSRGISLNGGTDKAEEESQIKKHFYDNSKKNILLLDSSKVAKNYFYLSVPFEKIDVVISEQPLPKQLKEVLEKNNVEIVY